MAKYFEFDEWSIIENGLNKEDNRFFESIMSLGNGHMGMRGNFEETYSGDSLQGTYVAGVYYPDKTRVGWWKNGYPEYFAKVLNATNFIGIKVFIDDKELDLAKCEFENFSRVLNMKEGYLERKFEVVDGEKRTLIVAKRFLSMSEIENAGILYSVTPVNYDAKIDFIPFLDGNVKNEDSNYDEIFWNEINRESAKDYMTLTMQTKKLDFHVTVSSKAEVLLGSEKIASEFKTAEDEKFVSHHTSLEVAAGKTATLRKYVTVVTNRDYKKEELIEISLEKLNASFEKSMDKMYEEHVNAWAEVWKESDVTIEGDVSAQQGIRFNIFQMKQTYHGHDSRLNIGPKGFTGEKYGGSTYWDTEAYCLPFFLGTADPSIPRNLLVYRYDHLERAKENAGKLGLKGALYPMVTMNGEECHNEWEITFEEIHRNAAIAYAIFNYTNYTGDKTYLGQHGFEVLTEISRFWADRANYNTFKDCYMILGVTGPNEYDNNVNNNWYTNRMAVWTLEYTLEVMDYLKSNEPERFNELVEKLNLEDSEITVWKDMIEKMYYPIIEELGIFSQQDGYMDKEQILVKDLDPKHLPINQNWSWDRILRSCFIKQADVLQGIYFLEDEFDVDSMKAHFDFYEPRTVHESSLSPCIYSIIASHIGYEDKAYELYLRTARLDLDNYNNDTDDGLHITSMTGSWIAITQGFGGMKVKEDTLWFNPFIPKAWNSYSFKIMFRGRLLNIKVSSDTTEISMEEGSPLTIYLYNEAKEVSTENKLVVETKK